MQIAVYRFDETKTQGMGMTLPSGCLFVAAFWLCDVQDGRSAAQTLH